MPSRDLPLKYTLSYVIGEVVRNDVFAETEMRLLWRELSAVLSPGDEMQREMGRLIKQVRSLLNRGEVPAAFRDIGRAVLDEAAAAHRLRNVFIHDQWLHLPAFRPGSIRSLRRTNENRADGRFGDVALADFERCADELKRSAWRLRGLWITAPYWLGQEPDWTSTDDELDSWTRVAMGHIADDPEMTRGTPGPAPQPLGGWGGLDRG